MRGKIFTEQIDRCINACLVDLFVSEVEDKFIDIQERVINLVCNNIKELNQAPNRLILGKLDIMRECACSLDSDESTIEYSFNNIVIDVDSTLTSNLFISKSYLISDSYKRLTFIAKSKNLSQKEIIKLIDNISNRVDICITKVVDSFLSYLINFLQVVIDTVQGGEIVINESILADALNRFKDLTLEDMIK